MERAGLLCLNRSVPDASPTPFLSICPVCQNPIDVSALEPFSKVACPHCGGLVRVRRNFDHFRIIKQIGEGGMSRVFEAEDETLGRRVALKILNRHFSRDAARVEQFKREALVTARISHLNVIKLYSTGEDHGYFYLAMELVGGGSLEQRIKNEGRLTEEAVLKIGLEVAEGLRAAQKEGLLHRDVKPANILFTDTGTAKVVDFGLAIFADKAEESADGEIWATPYYVAPEKVIENTEDFRSDIYSLGATLYHALTGRPPQKANTASLAELRRIKANRVLLEDSGLTFSPRTLAVVNRMLAVKPGERHAGYDAVVEDLRVAQRMAGAGARLMGTRRQQFLVGAAVAVVVAFSVGWLARSTGERAAKSIKAPSVVSLASRETGVTLTSGQPTVGERFREARDKVMNGEPEAGRQQFELLVAEGLKQPTLNWARFHLTVCAMERQDEKAARGLLEELARDGAAGELTGFFQKLGKGLSERWGSGVAVADWGFDRDNEEVMGYLLHGLAQWYFGDAEKGGEALRFFFDSMVPLKAYAASGAGTTVEWIPAYAAGFERRYAPDLDVAQTLARLKGMKEAKEVRSSLTVMEEMRDRLRTNGTLKETINRRIQSLKRDEVRLRMADQKKEMEELRALRQRELEQLQDLTELLPALAQGYDYSKVVEVLAGVDFRTAEVKAALEGKRYLYQEAQAFVAQLTADVARQPWTGVLRKASGATLRGTVTQLTTSRVTLNLERGVVELDLADVSAQTLVDMATAYTGAVTDSTDYYRRQERTAVFARVAGLPTVSAMIAAPLMEENRAFRMRWLKVL